MNSITYVLLSYGLTALMSIAVVGLIVVVNRLMEGKTSSGSEQEAE